MKIIFSGYYGYARNLYLYVFVSTMIDPGADCWNEANVG